ncbi:putative serine protease K12H4.7 [Culex quinquefasciatus]|uniref:putative serine protease K12H4.7 n=1 Tax=Culex quinquefasciatus TaxID=7176 RepID=UPI0018E2C79F|nr:putative serine protease K12H4.7 [Culex quinquefasciatus]
MKLLFLLAGFALVALLEATTTTPGLGVWERLHREPPVRGDPAKRVTRAQVSTKWIKQKLDHFDPQNPSTWSMRYMENGEHYVPGSPLFIFVGGEWTISAGSIQQGHFYDMAAEHRAYLFYTEHRYYGQSRPTVNTRTDQMRFLNVDQALADLAHFVEEMRRTIPGAENSKVIMVGGSYSATMVVWFRQKYPHLVNGVWASSAPLLAKLDFTEYKEVVSESIRLVGGDACADRVQRGVAEVEDLIKQGSYDQVAQAFNLCADTDLSNKRDRQGFLSSISDTFAGVVQYHWSGDIEGVCKVINDPNYNTDMEALAGWFTYGSTRCLDASYESMISYYRNTDWTHGANTGSMRPWLYQTCAEYGWYQTSGSENQIFGSGFPVDLYIQWCADLYDNKFPESSMHANVARTNTIYGHMNPEVTNVLFTQGQLDPWRPMGVQQDLNERSPAVVIPLASHVADLNSISDWDSTEMRAAKEKISELVRLWLA